MDLAQRQHLYSFLDITSLGSTDYTISISKWLNVILSKRYDGFTPAAICVFPVFVELVSTNLLESSIKTASVAAGFPDSQTFLQVKIAECKEAVRCGADEMDVVLNLNAFFAGNFDEVVQELKMLKMAIQPSTLKVIIESGVLSVEEVRKATELAIQGGADFVKTSTGRVAEGATLDKVATICEVLQSTRGIGLKISGGIRTIAQAESFYNLVEGKMGASFMYPSTFRIGASSLAETLRNG